MADVFLSYKSEDREVARALAEALQAEGLSVWWDRNLVGGEEYSPAILEQLDAAGVTVGLWSARAASSHWVAKEFERALQAQKLIPTRMDDTPRGPFFKQLHTIDLRGDAPLADRAGFGELAHAVRIKLADDIELAKPRLRQALAEAQLAEPPEGWVMLGDGAGVMKREEAGRTPDSGAIAPAPAMSPPDWRSGLKVVGAAIVAAALLFACWPRQQIVGPYDHPASEATAQMAPAPPPAPSPSSFTGLIDLRLGERVDWSRIGQTNGALTFPRAPAAGAEGHVQFLTVMAPSCAEDDAYCARPDGPAASRIETRAEAQFAAAMAILATPDVVTRERRFGEAVSALRRAAEAGYVPALNNLGVLYEHGDGVRRNQARARRYYANAAARGSAEAQNNLGVLLLSSAQNSADQAEGLRLLQQSASRGSRIAMTNIAVQMLDGDLLRRDLVSADAILTALSRAGVAEAQMGLAYARTRGEVSGNRMFDAITALKAATTALGASMDIRGEAYTSLAILAFSGFDVPPCAPRCYERGEGYLRMVEQYHRPAMRLRAAQFLAMAKNSDRAHYSDPPFLPGMGLSEGPLSYLSRARALASVSGADELSTEINPLYERATRMIEARRVEDARRRVEIERHARRPGRP